MWFCMCPPPTEAHVLPPAEQGDRMHDVPDRKFRGRHTDEGSGHGGDKRGGAGLALSGRTVLLQGNADILTARVTC